MSPITATAIPDGSASGTGLSATMANVRADTWKPAATWDDMNIELRLFFKNSPDQRRGR